jgi:hypothetical protein
MNLTWLNNAIVHWKTTVAGACAAVVLVGTVFLQNGVTIGHIGTTNYVTLSIALAVAIGGAVARDPLK